VNPARLNRERRMEVCMQCHLETTSFPLPRSILKYGRAPFSYRPGEPLADFELFFDKADAGPTEDRFQIVNSVYRLRMSACFLKSGTLECSTCHDPHDTPRGEPAAQHYNGVCLECHASGIRALVASGRHAGAGDCVGCHMPKRRTGDVVHAVLTDHYIQRKKPQRDLLAEIPEPHEPEIFYRGEVAPYPRPLPPGTENELYLALAQVRENSNVERGMERFRTQLQAHPDAAPEFSIELADAWLARGRPSDAIPLYQQAVRRKSDSLAGLIGLGDATEKASLLAAAADAFQRAARLYPGESAAWRKLGQVRAQQAQRTEALAALEKSTELDGEVPETHYALGTLWSQPGGNLERAEASFREAIRLQPDYAPAHMNLAILLFRRMQNGEADYEFAYAIRARPGYALGHFNYGLMLASLQRVDDARAQFEATLDADPKYAEAHQELGKLEEQSGRLDDAMREYGEAVRLQPGLSRSQLGLGAALARRGNRAEARAHLTLAASSSDAAVRDSARRLLNTLNDAR
jgi:predicted CXXCH cytochrome family protein